MKTISWSEFQNLCGRVLFQDMGGDECVMDGHWGSGEVDLVDSVGGETQYRVRELDNPSIPVVTGERLQLRGSMSGGPVLLSLLSRVPDVRGYLREKDLEDPPQESPDAEDSAITRRLLEQELARWDRRDIQGETPRDVCDLLLAQGWVQAPENAAGDIPLEFHRPEHPEIVAGVSRIPGYSTCKAKLSIRKGK